jgi:hypothetical protein
MSQRTPDRQSSQVYNPVEIEARRNLRQDTRQFHLEVKEHVSDMQDANKDTFSKMLGKSNKLFAKGQCPTIHAVVFISFSCLTYPFAFQISSDSC